MFIFTRSSAAVGESSAGRTVSANACSKYVKEVSVAELVRLNKGALQRASDSSAGRTVSTNACRTGVKRPSQQQWHG